MKKLVNFHICALSQLYVKVGPPPLEKFSGSAPDDICRKPTISGFGGSRVLLRLVITGIVGCKRNQLFKNDLFERMDNMSPGILNHFKYIKNLHPVENFFRLSFCKELVMV